MICDHIQSLLPEDLSWDWTVRPPRWEYVAVMPHRVFECYSHEITRSFQYSVFTTTDIPHLNQVLVWGHRQVRRRVSPPIRLMHMADMVIRIVPCNDTSRDDSSWGVKVLQCRNGFQSADPDDHHRLFMELMDKWVLTGDNLINT